MLDLMVAAKTNDNQLLTDFVLTSPAPIETAARLSNGFRLLAAREKARSRDLNAASEHCETMAVEVMALASDLHEAGGRSLLRSVDHRGVSMLDLLIECEQKQVDTHNGMRLEAAPPHPTPPHPRSTFCQMKNKALRVSQAGDVKLKCERIHALTRFLESCIRYGIGIFHTSECSSGNREAKK
jgi:hypothetical protein